MVIGAWVLQSTLLWAGASTNPGNRPPLDYSERITRHSYEAQAARSFVRVGDHTPRLVRKLNTTAFIWPILVPARR